jgi:hypothetical protein
MVKLRRSTAQRPCQRAERQPQGNIWLARGTALPRSSYITQGKTSIYQSCAGHVVHEPSAEAAIRRQLALVTINTAGAATAAQSQWPPTLATSRAVLRLRCADVPEDVHTCCRGCALFFAFPCLFSLALIATAPHTWLSHRCHAEATRSSCSAHSASFASRIIGYLAT